MRIGPLETGLNYLSLTLTVVLLWKLWKEGLHLRYRYFAAYLAWEAIAGIVLLQIPRNKIQYFYVFSGVRFVQWILDVLVTLDLVAVITKRYAGITTMARMAVTTCLGIASAIALVSAMVDVSTTPTKFPVLTVMQLVDRTVTVSILAFLGLILLFLLWFPVQLSRNTVAYAAGFIFVFAERFSALLLGNLLGPREYQVLSSVDIGIYILVVIYWTLQFSRQNETTERIVGHSWNRTAESRLVGQLESINRTLLRTTTKADPR